MNQVYELKCEDDHVMTRRVMLFGNVEPFINECLTLSCVTCGKPVVTVKDITPS